MSQISENINSSNHKIHYCDQIIEMVVNLGSKKGQNNYISSLQITRLQNSLLMSIFDTPKIYLSNVEGKSS